MIRWQAPLLAAAAIFAAGPAVSADIEVMTQNQYVGADLIGVVSEPDFNAAAIEFGLEKTARVITGAAAIMMAVFIAFAGSSLATVSQLGIGLTVAVILDATVVRIVLLPALMLLIGDRVWWLPRWLDRAMPKFEV